MSVADMLGIRNCKLNLQGHYEIDELYEKIKDVPFEAGKPQLVGLVIAWPKLDDNNQVQIMGGSGQFSVCRSATPAGELFLNWAKEEATNGLSTLSAAFGNKKKLCMELVTRTADAINALGL